MIIPEPLSRTIPRKLLTCIVFDREEVNFFIQNLNKKYGYTEQGAKGYAFTEHRAGAENPGNPSIRLRPAYPVVAQNALLWQHDP